MDRQTQALRTLNAGDRHHIDLPIRWGDTDRLGHLNNTVYFRLMEEARIQMFRQAGLEIPSEDYQLVLAHVSCDFVQPILYPADVRIIHHVGRVGRTSLQFDVAMSRPGNEADVYARARNVLVLVETGSGKPAPWPPVLLAAVAALFEPGNPHSA